MTEEDNIVTLNQTEYRTAHLDDVISFVDHILQGVRRRREQPSVGVVTRVMTQLQLKGLGPVDKRPHHLLHLLEAALEDGMRTQQQLTGLLQDTVIALRPEP